MRDTVTLERGTDGGYMAWVHELPGCVTRGATRAEVESKIGPAIGDFLAWARRTRGTPQQVELAITAEVESAAPLRDALTEILLEPDRAPLTQAVWSQVERLLRISRQDLPQTLRELDVSTLAWKSEGSRRSIQESLVHIGVVELMYAVGAFQLESPKDIAEFLRWTRRISIARMRALTRSDRGTMTHAFWGGAPHPESWTARKAARRMLWHERLHLRGIRRQLERKANSVPNDGESPP